MVKLFLLSDLPRTVVHCTEINDSCVCVCVCVCARAYVLVSIYRAAYMSVNWFTIYTLKCFVDFFIY
jgi:hypothetical protein